MKIRQRDFSEIFTEIKNIAKLSIHYLPSIIVFTLMALFSTVFGLLASLVSQSLIDFVTGSLTDINILQFESIYGVAGAAVAFTVFKILFSAFNSRISEKIRIRIVTEMTADIFDEFICSKWEYTSAFASGDILTRFNGDIGTVASSVIGIVPTFVAKLFQFISAFAIVFYYDKVMALISLITIPVSLLFSRILVKKMHTYAKELKKAGSRLTEFNSDSLLNMQYLKSFGLVTTFCVKLREMQREYVKISLDYNKFSIIVTSIMSFITQMISYACFGWGVFRLWQGEISVGTLVLFVELYGMLSGAFSSVIGIVPTVINATAASERITEIRNLPKDESLENTDVSDFFDKSSAVKLSLELKNVSFRYFDESEDALTNINFEGKSGDFIALTGASGEGKTTILRLLLALIECSEGEAVIRNLKTDEKIDIAPAVRKYFSYVPQKNIMFSDTLAENMRLVKQDATDDEIINALKIACAYDFIAKEKKGIYCNVGDGGTGFSEGQMQRLSIARAVLRNAPIILLDEATSALDIDTEKQVLANLAEWGKDKICIFTTHRTSVFEFCNRAYLVNGSDCNPVM